MIVPHDTVPDFSASVRYPDPANKSIAVLTFGFPSAIHQLDITDKDMDIHYLWEFMTKLDSGDVNTDQSYTIRGETITYTVVEWDQVCAVMNDFIFGTVLATLD